jgi:hypothetical protein
MMVLDLWVEVSLLSALAFLCGLVASWLLWKLARALG